MRAFMLNFQHFATAMLVMASYRRFCDRGSELWKVESVGGAEKVALCSLSTLLFKTRPFLSSRSIGCPHRSTMSARVTRRKGVNSSRVGRGGFDADFGSARHLECRFEGPDSGVEFAVQTTPVRGQMIWAVWSCFVRDIYAVAAIPAKTLIGSFSP